MKIETKFDVGQEVYNIVEYYDYNKGSELDMRLYGYTDKKHKEVKKWKITNITLSTDIESKITLYSLESNGLVMQEEEEDIFATREEAKEKLKESIKVKGEY